jgi:hypothetical protein
MNQNVKHSEIKCFRDFFLPSFINYQHVSKVDFQKLSKVIQYWSRLEATLNRNPNIQK